jgi:hypothetical protein
MYSAAIIGIIMGEITSLQILNLVVGVVQNVNISRFDAGRHGAVLHHRVRIPPGTSRRAQAERSGLPDIVVAGHPGGHSDTVLV